MGLTARPVVTSHSQHVLFPCVSVLISARKTTRSCSMPRCILGTTVTLWAGTWWGITRRVSQTAPRDASSSSGSEDISSCSTTSPLGKESAFRWAPSQEWSHVNLFRFITAFVYFFLPEDVALRHDRSEPWKDVARALRWGWRRAQHVWSSTAVAVSQWWRVTCRNCADQ